jgi:hypothetical protein
MTGPWAHAAHGDSSRKGQVHSDLRDNSGRMPACLCARRGYTARAGGTRTGTARWRPEHAPYRPPSPVDSRRLLPRPQRATRCRASI